MSIFENWSWALDGWIVAAGVLCAVASALLGNFLVLRRMSMLGDAISHAVLPGLAASFFLTESRNSWPMFVGAVLAGVLTAFFTEWIRGAGKVDEGASMGVVFTSLFALGLIMIVRAADHVDLDPGCVLYGAIEMTPLDLVDIRGFLIPRAVVTLSVVTVINLLFVGLFWKELKISSFDSGLATTVGFSSRLIHYLLMILVAVTAVASFESVGNILVVAMLVVPASAAYMLTDRLLPMIFVSVVLAAISAVTGHLSAIIVPSWFGFESTTTAGMMAVSAGGILFLSIVFSPKSGVLIRFVRQRLLAWQILEEDVVAFLYRIEERKLPIGHDFETLRRELLADFVSMKVVLNRLVSRSQLVVDQGEYKLTDEGRLRAESLVRSHRLWEEYLVSHVGIDADRLHQKAERLEHFTDKDLRERLNHETNAPENDPHGRPIPAERDSPKSDQASTS
ncbi:Manganese transport system membrane protein MntB [Thalassoglobus neptunius]|uniref:Manganese transport system membrane protein MntB n=1 Tax=Thalassoglobus neptunius TaxID=1938619 RepID=A0A5C5X0R1_9PLAN|nr:metal ABC transporter permease [Thalassoglobus neptunius]TWT55755.1 Manganese transport system membrane protein MntB [Thalassoglobus neptunius]